MTKQLLIPPCFLGFTRRLVGIPKAESDTILQFLFRQISENPDYQVRFSWEENDVALWDNRVKTMNHIQFLDSNLLTLLPYLQVVTHSATFDFWPHTRHALRATPHGDTPISVEDYERTTGKQAKDRQLEIWKQQGVKVEQITRQKNERTRGYND